MNSHSYKISFFHYRAILSLPTYPTVSLSSLKPPPLHSLITSCFDLPPKKLLFSSLQMALQLQLQRR